MNSRATQQYEMSPYFSGTGKSNDGTASSTFLLAKKCSRLARTCIMKMRNQTCVGTQTPNVSTRVALLFIFYFVVNIFSKVTKT